MELVTGSPFHFNLNGTLYGCLSKKNIYLKQVYLHFQNRYLFMLFMLLHVQVTFSQPNSSSSKKAYDADRFTKIIVTESVVTSCVLISLHYLWYKKYPHSRFHFFNDNKEWFGMDKLGHATTAYNISTVQSGIMQSAGINNRDAAWIGGLTALGFQTIIEIFDGFSQNWGFSPGDMLANMAGTALFLGQQFAWNEQRVYLNFSCHHTLYANYNPEVLGRNKWQRWLKDYNGQTYWLTVNPGSFLAQAHTFLRWLDVSVGYGGEGMIGASCNPVIIKNKQVASFTRTHKFLLSVQPDLYRIVNINSSNSSLLSIPAILKFPAPAFELKNDKLKFTFIYF